MRILASLFLGLVLILRSCNHAAFDKEAPEGIAPLSVIDLSPDFEHSDISHFAVSQHYVIATFPRGDQTWLVRYDAKGKKLNEFAISGEDDLSVLRDIAVAEGTGEIGLLSEGKQGAAVLVLTSSGKRVRQLRIKEQAAHLAMTLGQVFAIDDSAVIRADDDTILEKLPSSGAYYLTVSNNVRLVAMSRDVPLLYTYDLTTSVGETHRLDAPELLAALQRTAQQRPANGSLISAVAAGEDNSIYVILAPEMLTQSVLKINTAGQATETLTLRLPAMPALGSATACGVGYAGDQLLLFAPLGKAMVFYSAQGPVFVP